MRDRWLQQGCFLLRVGRQRTGSRLAPLPATRQRYEPAEDKTRIVLLEGASNEKIDSQSGINGRHSGARVRAVVGLFLRMSKRLKHLFDPVYFRVSVVWS